MSSQFAMSAMSVAEFGLWALLGFLFWKRRLHRRFQAMGIYLALRVVSTPVLVGRASMFRRNPGAERIYRVYFYRVLGGLYRQRDPAVAWFALRSSARRFRGCLG